MSRFVQTRVWLLIPAFACFAIVLAHAPASLAWQEPAAPADQAAAEPAAPAEEAPVYDVIQLSEPPRSRALVSGMVKSGNITNEQAFRGFFEAQIAALTLPENFGKMQATRKGLRRFLQESGNAARKELHAALNQLYLDRLLIIVRGNYHPYSRLNAMLLIGELNEKEKAPSQKAPPEPYLPAFDKMVEEIAQPQQVDVVLAGAFQSFQRFIDSGKLSVDQKAALATVLVALAENAEVPSGRDPKVHNYFREKSVDYLGLMGSAHIAGNDEAVVNVISALITDEDENKWLRICAARALGGLDLTTTSLDLEETTHQMARLWVAVVEEELSKIPGRAVAAAGGGGMFPGGMGGPGGAGMPGGPGGAGMPGGPGGAGMPGGPGGGMMPGGAGGGMMPGGAGGGMMPGGAGGGMMPGGAGGGMMPGGAGGGMMPGGGGGGNNRGRRGRGRNGAGGGMMPGGGGGMMPGSDKDDEDKPKKKPAKPEQPKEGFILAFRFGLGCIHDSLAGRNSTDQAPRGLVNAAKNKDDELKAMVDKFNEHMGYFEAIDIQAAKEVVISRLEYEVVELQYWLDEKFPEDAEEDEDAAPAGDDVANSGTATEGDDQAAAGNNPSPSPPSGGQ